MWEDLGEPSPDPAGESLQRSQTTPVQHHLATGQRYPGNHPQSARWMKGPWYKVFGGPWKRGVWLWQGHGRETSHQEQILPAPQEQGQGPPGGSAAQ